MTRLRRAVRAGSAALCTALALACGEDDSTTGTTGSIQIAVNPTTLELLPGTSGSVTATMTRAGGFSGPVTLAVSGLPAGATALITPTQLAGATTNATIHLTLTAAVAPGTYTATVTATAQGVSEAMASYQLAVTPLADYALTVGALTIAAGASGSATIGIARTSFTGGVNFSMVNPSLGITASFNPSPAQHDAASLVLSVAAGVNPGTYPLTIRGIASGVAERLVTLQLTVTPPSVTGRSIRYEYCDASEAPVLFAYQDGSGVWQAVPPTNSGSTTNFSFTLTQNHGGIAAVYRIPSSLRADALAVRVAYPQRNAPGRSALRNRFADRRGAQATVHRTRLTFADTYETEVIHASALEHEEIGVDSCSQALPTKTITGTVTGVAPGQYGVVSLGTSTTIFNGATATNPITLADVPGGPVDLIATRITKPGMPPDKVIVVRNLDIPGGGALPVTVAYDGQSAFAPASATASVAGGGADNLEIFTELVTPNGATLMWFDLAPSTVSARPWAGLPQSALLTGEYHTIVVFAHPPGGNPGDYRVALKYVGPVVNHTIALGAPLSAPAVSTVAAAPNPRFRFRGNITADYNKGIYLDTRHATGNGWSLTATSAWLAVSGSATAYDITMPDLSTLSGFPVGARLTPGENDLLFVAFGFTGGPGVLELEPTLGGESKVVEKRLVMNVP